MLTYEHHYINGAWVKPAQAAEQLEVIDSHTATTCARVPAGGPEDIERAVEAARAAFDSWSQTPMQERKAKLAAALANWQKKKPKAIEWLQKELGCTKKFASQVQVNLVDAHFGVSLNVIDGLPMEEKLNDLFVVKEPIGVVGCITPWNYPLNQIAAKIGPAMLVGCTVVLKPSEVTPICAYLLAEAIHEAGFPKGVFNMVLGTGPGCGEHLAAHPQVDMISFTGSTRAGRRISEVAAATLKVVRTELGGKSAAVMLDDAPLDKLVPEFMQQLMNNSGQSCDALSRMLVPRSKYDEAVQRAKDFAEKLKVGGFGDEKASMGPLVSEVQWEKVQGLIQKGIEEGARVVCGGPGKPEGLGDGFYVRPTVFADVKNNMTIAQEEIFGPVLSIIPYDAESDAIAIANDTIYGLNNAVGSADADRALSVARRLRSGTVMINGTARNMEAPFGGLKQSGNAREWGRLGIEEYLVTKTLAGRPKAKL